MTRIMIYALVTAFILWLFGASGAAHEVLSKALSLVKWLFILGIVGFIVYLIYDRVR